MPRPRAHHDVRDQEVLRANHELAAYFGGERTEREAKAALKIIKAFVRERQHTPPEKRRPLPGMKAAPARPAKPKPERAKKRPARKRGRPVAVDAPKLDEITPV
jgi:hypothetical protein